MRRYDWDMVPTVEQKKKSPLVSVEEYRKILGDYSSSEENILSRLNYLEAFCRNVARFELEEYVKNTKAKRKHG